MKPLTEIGWLVRMPDGSSEHVRATTESVARYRTFIRTGIHPVGASPLESEKEKPSKPDFLGRKAVRSRPPF